MKFQNPSIHRSKVNKCTHTHTHTESNMPFQLFQRSGHKNGRKFSNGQITDVYEKINYPFFALTLGLYNM